MRHHWGLIGAPSSAGAHTPGLERGPAALREAGLPALLRAGGAALHDHGDVPGFRWRPDPAHPHAQNASVVARVARDVAGKVRGAVADGHVPFVLGGDCTITLGLVAGRTLAGRTLAGEAPALVYVDGGPDLYTPATRPNGNLDAMGLAHMLALPATVPEIVDVGPRTPLLTADRVVVYGDSLPTGDHERDLVEELGITYVPASEVRADPGAAAARARTVAEAAAPAFLVHLDVDVLAFVGAPLADVPEPFGLTLEEVATTLATLVASPRFAGLALTEVNPDHVPDPGTLRDFVEILATALTG
ncbi:MAG TPA: arginase family protein [Catenuloplanes sp.]|jgi:arginase